jgi:hypothetical protein
MCILRVSQGMRKGEKKREEKEKKDPSFSSPIFRSRFARARKHDVDQAYEMLKENLKWREDNKIDSIDEWFGQTEKGKALIKMWPQMAYGFTEQHHPVLMEHMMVLDPPEVFAVYSQQECVNYHIWVMERELQRMHDKSEELGSPVTKVIMCQNSSGLAFKHFPVLEVLKELANVDEKNYPEFLKSLVVINAPTIISLVIKFLKPFIDPDTFNKILIFSSSDEWQKDERFLKVMTTDLMPKKWGGTSEIEFTKTGDVMEEKTFLDLHIEAGKVAEVKFSIEVDKSNVAFEFRCTGGHDVEFSIEHGEGKKKKLLVSPVRSMRLADYKFGLEVGAYVMKFSNEKDAGNDNDLQYYCDVTAPMSAKEIKAQKRRTKTLQKKIATEK